ncbi:MAG: gutB 1 [Acidobacteria bacterium]|nr:gutB 1 [Acidobacteriota bacterium]
MRALYLNAPGSLQFRDTSPLEAPPGWVRIRMRYTGICGSDIHYFTAGRIGDQVVTSPFVLGHEGSGEILDGGEAFSAGLPVYIEPAIPCHRCDQCLSGRENTCRSMRFLGNPLETGGCMREEIAMPHECIVPIPGWMSLEEAVLLEPLSIGMYAVDRRAATMLGAGAVFDPGTGGAADAVSAASKGGVDLAFECAGTQQAIDDAARMLKPGGTLVLIGIPEGIDRVTYDPHLMRRREITVINVRRQNRMVERAISLLERRRDAAAVLITHRFPASNAAQAFSLVQRRGDGAIKVLLEF